MPRNDAGLGRILNSRETGNYDGRVFVLKFPLKSGRYERSANRYREINGDAAKRKPSKERGGEGGESRPARAIGIKILISRTGLAVSRASLARSRFLSFPFRTLLFPRASPHHLPAIALR